MGDQKIVGIDGAECVLSGAVIHTFASELQGTLLAREHPDYDSARRVWNGSVDKWPALIVRCSGTGDVVACVRLAREHDLLVSVRGGGHNIAGKSVCDGGLMIDLSPMNGIVVDPHRETARVQGGAKLGDMDRATQAFGLRARRAESRHSGLNRAPAATLINNEALYCVAELYGGHRGEICIDAVASDTEA